VLAFSGQCAILLAECHNFVWLERKSAKEPPPGGFFVFGATHATESFRCRTAYIAIHRMLDTAHNNAFVLLELTSPAHAVGSFLCLKIVAW
jgi:hypothetical protein